MNYVSFPPRTSLKPRLTVRQPIISSVLSPTLLQIYCIGLITHFFWIWATICDPTNLILTSLVLNKLLKKINALNISQKCELSNLNFFNIKKSR